MSLASLFCCCAGPRARDASSDEPDENTRLIAPVDEPIPQPRHAVDSDRMKERLGHIVRSKEGKMVNLQASAPFAPARSASRDDEQSQSTSSLSAPDPDDLADEQPSVRLVRGASASAARGRAGVRRISPSGLGASARAQEEGSGAEVEAEVVPATPDAIQPVGSLSRSWGD